MLDRNDRMKALVAFVLGGLVVGWVGGHTDPGTPVPLYAHFIIPSLFAMEGLMFAGIMAHWSGWRFAIVSYTSGVMAIAASLVATLGCVV